MEKIFYSGVETAALKWHSLLLSGDQPLRNGNTDDNFSRNSSIPDQCTRTYAHKGH